jgi:hypothetical protein
MNPITELQILRQALQLDNQELGRYSIDPQQNTESIATVKRTITEKEARIAFLKDLPLILSLTV